MRAHPGRECGRRWRLIGDWWAFGEKRYGARKAVVEAPDWDGPSYDTVRGAAVVSNAFEPCRRRHALSFSHHREVAALPPPKADALLDWAAEPNDKPRSTRALRAEQFGGDDPVAFVVSANLGRRHSTASERAIVAANLANLKHGGDRRSDQGANLPLEKPPPISIPQAAEMLRVSPRLVKDAILLKPHEKGMQAGIAEHLEAPAGGRV